MTGCAGLPYGMRYLAPILTLGTVAAAPSPASSQRQPPPTRLVVFIAVDQLRPDYFTRYEDQLTGGLRRFYAEGAFFARGEQDHAITETAPGHATMLSGRSPASVGVVTNELGVSDSLAPLLLVAGPGASPRRFRGTTLFDWMAAADPATRVLSVSRKDRGAILPIGRAKVPVYWYAGGVFTTSTYYGDRLPQWLLAWNFRRGPQNLAGRVWNLLLPADRYAEPDSQPWERGGRAFRFPYPFSPDSQQAALQAAGTPYLDSLTLDLALEGVHRLGLGSRNGTDLLAVSLSATDAVGHAWGPNSREIHDQVLRLDRWLGWFQDSLARVLPADRILYALTSDHGVTPLPGYLLSQGRMAGRVVGDTVPARADANLAARHRRRFGLEFNTGLIFGDTTSLHRAGVDVDSLARSLASQLARYTGVTRTYTPATLAAAPENDVDAGRWKRTIPSDFAWLAAASLAPGYTWAYPGFEAAMHGATTGDDVLVPIAFLGRGIAAGQHTRARTVDIAPTLAALLGITPGEAVEGRVLREVVRK